MSEPVRMVWRDDTGHEIDLGTAQTTTDEHGVRFTADLAGLPAVEAGHTFTLSFGYQPEPDLGATASPTTGARTWLHSYGPDPAGLGKILAVRPVTDVPLPDGGDGHEQ